MKYIFYLFLLTFSNQVLAQNLQGKVTDGNTGDGIPFASVSIVGSNFSTVTNENGDFVIKISSLPSKIRASHVSYNTIEANVTNINSPLTLKLRPATITLTEITIDPFRGEKIVKAALEKAIENTNTNFYANAFYRQLTSLNGKASQIYELF